MVVSMDFCVFWNRVPIASALLHLAAVIFYDFNHPGMLLVTDQLRSVFSI